MPGPSGTQPKGVLSPMSCHPRALGPDARVGSISPCLPNSLRVAFGAHRQSVLDDATVRSETNLPAHFDGCDGRVPNVVALWVAFYIENKRFDLDTLRVPSRSPHPDFEI
jgi:hypothetical protein